MNENKEWVMPEWMEPYRDLIVNTGGNPIEDLMNDNDSNLQNNTILTLLIVGVRSQILLLTKLHSEGII